MKLFYPFWFLVIGINYSAFGQIIHTEQITRETLDNGSDFFNPDDEVIQATYSYDSLGRLTHYITLPLNDKVSYFYDNDRLVTIEERADGEITQIIDVKYSGDTIVYVGTDDTQTDIYDSLGRIQKRTHTSIYLTDKTFEYRGDTTIEISSDIVYGNELKEYYNPEHDLIRHDSYIEIETDTFTDEPSFRLETKIWTYQYEYDEFGNWTRKEMWHQNKMVKLETRVITYY